MVVLALSKQPVSGKHGAPGIACSRCSLGRLCIPAGLDRRELSRFERIVHKSPPFQSGQHLFRSHDAFNQIAAVRSGCFKSYVVNKDGSERVVGFHLPGEIIGLDAIHPGKHLANVVALDTSSVCSLPFSDMSRLAAELPGLQQQLFKVMSQRIGEVANIAADRSADQKLALFLTELSRRFEARGYSAREFNLAMARSDIANYLRLATETVSRVLARFHRQGLINVNRKHIELLNTDALLTIAHSGDAPAD